ncbi:copper resistance protein B [Erythrobacter sp. sf7]|uniref:Copper resistance protein B n=1 Tax=Erythrobacter fulvus TaxID=2987523 RepID=A0ABT5JP21_9SPHN|nr:copper resistance protein B [Erythrobacter fulvus]MDC8754266.1 copper resistance protein B [Erythrobacter fulvus]
MLIAALAATLATPALAQHQHHAMPAQEPEPQQDRHAGHDMGTQEPDPHAGHDMGAMEKPVSPGPTMETPPPAAAGSGPPRAADAIWGAEAMAASREELRKTHGDFPVFWFQGDRMEAQLRNGADIYLWDIQGYYGGPTKRLWFKSEGEGAFGDNPDDAEVQALYAKAIMPFWDVQAGIRHDIGGPDTTHAVIGVQGLAPYMFEVDAALFLSTRGDVTARIEGEIDQRITQRLILQPRIEANLSAQDIPLLGIGAGLDSIEVGARLRYEFIREFAPYIGIEQSWRTGRSADFARARGEDPSVTSFVAGIRFWF